MALIQNIKVPATTVTYENVTLETYLTNSFTQVRPWQFGAIGDGTPHPLSERYSTLAAAQAVYPHVTSLSQTIDWAALQGADNYARTSGAVVLCDGELGSGKNMYHFGSTDYLELGISSKWIGSRNVNRDTASVWMIRTKPGVKPTFGQDCVVRVMDASEAGSADEFVRGIVFDGFVLSRGVARRSASKGDGSICFHANYGMGMSLGIVAFGAEYGIFGYSFWASTGWLKIDSCHKAFFADATVVTPEHPTTPVGSVNTTFNFDIRIDACVYGLVLKRIKYSSFRGYIEGIAIGTPSVPFPIYDSVNETCIAVTAIQCDSVDIEQLGIEYWEGVHIYNQASTISCNLSWTQDKVISNASGKHGAYHSMSILMGTADPYMLPSTDNSLFYNLSVGCLTVRNLTGDFSNTAQFSNVYFLTTDANSRTVFENCAYYFGSNTARFSPGFRGTVETVGGRYIVDAITPSGYTKIGPNYFVKTSWSTKAISGGDGRVQLAVGSDIPSNLKIHNVDAYVIAGATTQPIGLSHVSANDTVVVFQSSATTSAYSVNWKATVSWTA